MTRTLPITALLFLLATVARAQSAPAPDYKSWGLATIDQIEKDFSLPKRNLYAEKTKLAQPAPQSPAFAWGAGVPLSALVAAAQIDKPAYLPNLRRFITGLDAYWQTAGPVPGYDVLPLPKPADRYYDDNAWLVLSLAAAATAACAACKPAAAPSSPQPLPAEPSSAAPIPPATPTTSAAPSTLIDIGSAEAYEADALYTEYREDGFFVLRRGNQLLAFSSLCTHKGCKVSPREDGTFECKCHHSRFDSLGKVTAGPATANLPRLALTTSRGRVFVDPTPPAPR
jgi:Rieske Fe-S protein